MKRSKSSRILKILSYVLLITGMIVILYPFYLTIITALKTPQESSQSFFSFPQSFYLGNFVNVLQKANYFVFFRNSAVVTLVSVFLIMVLIPMCSYAIARNIEELENYLKEMVIVICSGKENTKKKSKIVEEIVHYVENNYYKNISLRELAENKYFVNYSYCSRLFSQETGMNFSKYLIQYRLKKAKTLLENKDMKISFIAFEVGYNDVSHFIQSFKKSYGLTPEEYRARKKIE